LHRDEIDKNIGMNDIARIRLRTASPLLVDEYRRNRTTGSFVLIDPNSNLTVAAGFIS
jgi:sulfate adenylyltransferase subunit 1 (EFTu-like GTPase family)